MRRLQRQAVFKPQACDPGAPRRLIAFHNHAHLNRGAPRLPLASAGWAAAASYTASGLPAPLDLFAGHGQQQGTHHACRERGTLLLPARAGLAPTPSGRSAPWRCPCDRANAPCGAQRLQAAQGSSQAASHTPLPGFESWGPTGRCEGAVGGLASGAEAAEGPQVGRHLAPMSASCTPGRRPILPRCDGALGLLLICVCLCGSGFGHLTTTEGLQVHSCRWQHAERLSTWAALAVRAGGGPLEAFRCTEHCGAAAALASMSCQLEASSLQAGRRRDLKGGAQCASRARWICPG